MLGALVLAGVTVGCSAPELSAPPPDMVPDTEDDLTSDVPDPARDELVDLLAQLSATVDQAQVELGAATEADDLVATRRHADAALALLLDDPATTSGDGRPLFPAVSTERATSGDEDDLLTSALSLARQVEGPLGRDVVETLRDPVAGDLGAWERDAEGVIEDLRGLTAGVTSIEDATSSIPEVPGDGTRALAWTLLAASSPDPALASAAAEWAQGHLGVVVVALTLLGEEEPAPDDDATDAPDDEAAAGATAPDARR